MWDGIIDGILEAIKLGAIEKFQESRDKALRQLHHTQTQASRDKISEVIRQIKEIDRIIQKVHFKCKLMKLTEEQQKLIAGEVVRKFEERRAELVIEKARLTRS
ncbi:hypothetical protein [Paenibacillus hamazuiensis]|uniref:hypothetical protein n=1 Tax=Paenibacillus hamazuiensis TaxID=2936508 RepID=UPI00200F6900|nr:hypothetical protein [Paenibacillus hamazuiensis]